VLLENVGKCWKMLEQTQKHVGKCWNPKGITVLWGSLFAMDFGMRGSIRHTRVKFVTQVPNPTHPCEIQM
jgi:hypothetical protein